ncbi:protein of unknown function DUF461 [Rhizobium sp. PDO1-076]|uniref:DUF1775 domain-containing protein n=1 Tax=Rhizobium sp. PDO1-076 TaxID=1125979 RepID=UPI00024E23C4|nr:DUF1775 domain-containing protein [Rhizobium sp. PDO1-076]EHS51925.1 protein of unknown function DUF461 [Rhizobium sp. PDO1-076]
MNTKLIATTALVALVSTGAAFAHASFANAPVAVGSYVAATLQVPHGCDGKATNEVQIKLPEGFISAKPQPKAGWEIEVISGDYQNSYDNHGKAVTSGPVEIRFKNGNLPDEFYDTFTIYGKVAAADPETGLAFPTIQVCGADATVAWTDIAAAGQDPHDLKSPAPVLKIAAAAGADEHAGHGAPATGAHAGHDAHAGHGDHAAAVNPGGFDVVTLGDLELSGGFTKAMLPGQPVGGGFITITNKGAEDDVLIAATSPNAGEVQLHEMAMVNDVMKMRQLPDGITIPAGQSVELKPGGLHLMFFKISEPFRDGATVPVTLTFQKAGNVDVVLPIGPARSN